MSVIASLKQAGSDVWLLWLSVFFRMMSYGLTNQVLTLFLESIDISPKDIGTFMALTLVGDVVISYALTWNADWLGRRRVLIVGTIMMAGAGVVFSRMSNWIILLVGAIMGVISPSGDETGPFKSVEEAVIAHITPHDHRPEIFAIHSLCGTTGAALGALLCGFVVDFLNLRLQWDLETCYRMVFVLYTLIAVVKFFIMLGLSDKCEYDELQEFINGENSEDEQDEDNGEINNSITESTPLQPRTLAAGSTWNVASKLLVVFFLDSFGYGFMPSSWVVYYFKTSFKITATSLGILFFITNATNSVTTLPSAFLAKLLGPVKAILFTQAPSAIFFIAVGFCPQFLLAAVFLVLYYSTTAMDVVPRQVLLTSVVKKEDLTKVMGTVNMTKTFARCIGPVFTGMLAERGALHFGYVINGGCVLMADMILAYFFVSMDRDILKLQKR